MKVLKTDQQIDVLRLMMEGSSIASISRYTGYHRDTCSRLMLRFGEACKKFLDSEMHDLQFRHLQLDEMWTYCRKKQFRITGNEPDTEVIGDYYIFVALDEDTRLIPVHLVDRRNKESTETFIRDIYCRIKRPRPHQTDDHAYYRPKPEPLVRISTDAFPAYAEVIRSVFGRYAVYAQIKKTITAKKLTIEKQQVIGSVPPADITTSLVERSNLNARTFLKRLNRKTLAFSKKLENLRSAVAIYVTHYNYCWLHGTLKATPAMAAGLIRKRWSLAELYDHLRQRWPEHFLNNDRRNNDDQQPEVER